ncbi:DUF2188 domain-containing protein [Cupriavidus nantongensis]|uniref:DUF2188 domain-containing protein n=1 Tax=Cupriavidus nantongensis TaxID=1796606 RepID=UPI002247C2E3|nr:DUF2188 domain-containing protein [Cupriavidus nantongensis]
MIGSTVHVMPAADGEWTVEDDKDAERASYASRAEAIAAGVHKALENEAVLLILGRTNARSEFDFCNCGVAPKRN